MNMDDAKREVVVREFLESRFWPMLLEEIHGQKAVYAALVGRDQYADALAANRSKALDDLTDRLLSYMDETDSGALDESEAGASPKTLFALVRPMKPTPQPV